MVSSFIHVLDVFLLELQNSTDIRVGTLAPPLSKKHRACLNFVTKHQSAWLVSLSACAKWKCMFTALHRVLKAWMCATVLAKMVNHSIVSHWLVWQVAQKLEPSRASAPQLAVMTFCMLNYNCAKANYNSDMPTYNYLKILLQYWTVPSSEHAQCG